MAQIRHARLRHSAHDSGERPRAVARDIFEQRKFAEVKTLEFANELIAGGTPVLMTNFSKILNQMGNMYTEERYRYIRSFSNYPLLIIDDLGIERSTEYAKEQVYAVVDERYKSGLPIIVTTNLTIGEIREPRLLADARITSRILEMCVPVNVNGPDRRRAKADGKQELMRELLRKE